METQEIVASPCCQNNARRIQLLVVHYKVLLVEAVDTLKGRRHAVAVFALGAGLRAGFYWF